LAAADILLGTETSGPNVAGRRAMSGSSTKTAVSRTAVEEFTPCEKVSGVLHFTPEEAQRATR